MTSGNVRVILYAVILVLGVLGVSLIEILPGYLFNTELTYGRF